MMSELIKIVRNPRGYYTLTVNGIFEGNFDTAKEAADEAKAVLEKSA